VFIKASHWTLSQPNPYLPKVQLNVILPPTPRSSQWSLTFGPPNPNPSPMRAINATETGVTSLEKFIKVGLLAFVCKTA
jgi:hypothetical protein